MEYGLLVAEKWNMILKCYERILSTRNIIKYETPYYYVII